MEKPRIEMRARPRENAVRMTKDTTMVLFAFRDMIAPLLIGFSLVFFRSGNESDVNICNLAVMLSFDLDAIDGD